ncbi:hypothetical protein H8356DRAFT_1328490 [Neocallimastix lanati (nom. inval.)]|nr:hypothetical protein H8356DRAFT_1328490 [Neocallimastix sp. JGI-2020a]
MVIHLSLLHKAMASHVHFSYEETSSGDILKITLMLMLTYTLLEFTSLNILKIMFNAI